MTSQSHPNPYIGPRAFQDGERLYGRDRELSKLLNLLIAERIVLLYSPSGAGKTSLIQAALMPALREEGFRLLPVIRVGMEAPPELELPATSNRYLLSTLLSLEEGLPPDQQTPLDELAGMDLTGYLDRRCADDAETDGDLLIFDQFEEILTVDPTDQKAKTAFFAQLGQALRPRNRWALFAMREEYPAGLDPYLRPIPTRLNTTFRLELLGVKAARDAMQEPARQAGRPFRATAATKLIDDLRRVQVQQPDGSTAERPGTSIEPVQLQVVCYRLWENLSEEATEIRESDIREAGDVDSALAGYYAERVKTIAEHSDVRERTIREWFDRQLITEQGIRGQVLHGPEQSQGLDNQAIAPLVDAHLVRAENRRGATWYELAHDRLIKPVRKNNTDWFQLHLSTLQRQATLWESQNRSKGLLLRDDALIKAEDWAKSHENDLIPIEHDFLFACREARTLAQKEGRKNRFIQGLAIVATIIMLVAIYFFVQTRREAERARQAEHNAEIRAEEALEAKNEAEEARFETEIRRKEAEDAKIKAEHQSHISLTQVLAFQALYQQEKNKEDERAALLARQAYLFNQKYQVSMLHQVDNALRSVLSAPHFCHILHSHEVPVTSVAFSPDSRILASASKDGTLRLWDLPNPVAAPIILHGHDATVWSVLAFSPDGKTLASGSMDQTVRLWDLTTPEKTPIILRGHESTVTSVAFSPDGKTLASGSLDSTVRLWDLTRPDTAPTILSGYKDTVWSVVFSPDGKRLASGASGWLGRGDHTVWLWDLENLAAAPTVLDHAGGISVVFSPNGQMLASGGWDKTVYLWNLMTPGAEPRVLHGHNDWVNSLAFSPDGQILASGSTDNTVRLWKLTNPSAMSTVLYGHWHWVNSVAFSLNGKTLASGSADGTVRLWDLQYPAAEPTVLSEHESYIHSVAFSSNDRMLASGSVDRTVRLWDLTTPNTAPSVLRGHESIVFSVAFSPDSKRLASGSEDKTVRLWDLKALATEPLVLRGHESAVYSVAFSPDGRTLVSGSGDKTVWLWDLTNLDAAPLVLRGHESDVYSVAFSSDGRILVSGSGDKTVWLWDLTNLDAAPTVLHGHEDVVRSVAFSSDGKTLASGSHDGTIRLWDLENLTVTPTILDYAGGGTMAFSPDGKTLASGSWDKTVPLWNLITSGAAPSILRGHESIVFSVAFSPDGKTLASGSMDKTIRLWIWRTENLAEMVCEKVWRNLTMEEWRQFVGFDIPYERICPNLPVHPSVLEAGQNLAKDGNPEGAIAIFQRILDLEPEDEATTVQIQSWVEALQAGKNPFTPEELRSE